MRTRRMTAALALGLVGLTAPGLAAASCAEFPPLEDHLAQADVVFVGIVVTVTDEKRTALVEVEEIWHGPGLPTEVAVHGGFPDLGFTTADRYFDGGVRYLFAPLLNDGRLEDNACSATQTWSEELLRLRPSTVATPEPAEADASGGPLGVPIPILVMGLTAAVVAGVGVVVFRSRAL